MSSTTITYLNVLSATDSGYSYGNQAPVITIGSSVPPSKIAGTSYLFTRWFWH